MGMNSYWNSQLTSKPIYEYINDKRLSAQSLVDYMLVRLNKMFKYNNLPETIPQEILETYLMQNGTCFITKVKGELYAFLGSMGGEPDPYYRPTLYIIANPALKYNATLDIQKDGVLMRNDVLWTGLAPLMSQYACLMSENLLTIRLADVMLRTIAFITAPDDSSRLSAELYLKKLENGELGVIGDNPFFDGVKLQSPPSNNGSYLTQFIELHQYLKASFYNEVGLDANYNMKREAIMQGESMLNKDALLPLCDNMLQCRKEDVSRLNEMYGTDITVDFDSAWKQNIEEIQMAMEGDSQLTGGVSNESQEESNEGTGQSINTVAGVSDIGTSDISDGTDIDSNGRNDDEQGTTNDADTSSNSGSKPSDGESQSGESGTEEDSSAGNEGRVEITINNISQLIEGGEENGGREDSTESDGTDEGDRNSDDGRDG